MKIFLTAIIGALILTLFVVSMLNAIIWICENIHNQKKRNN